MELKADPLVQSPSLSDSDSKICLLLVPSFNRCEEKYYQYRSIVRLWTYVRMLKSNNLTLAIGVLSL